MFNQIGILAIFIAVTAANHPLDHKCGEQTLCEMTFEERGIYYFERENAHIQRIEMERFQDSKLDVSNLPALASMYIKHDVGLPQDRCKLLKGSHGCVDIYITSEKPTRCCMPHTPESKTKAVTAMGSQRSQPSNIPDETSAKTAMGPQPTKTAMGSQSTKTTRSQLPPEQTLPLDPHMISHVVSIIIIAIACIIIIPLMVFIIRVCKRRRGRRGQSDIELNEVNVPVEPPSQNILFQTPSASSSLFQPSSISSSEESLFNVATARPRSPLKRD